MDYRVKMCIYSSKKICLYCKNDCLHTWILIVLSHTCVQRSSSGWLCVDVYSSCWYYCCLQCYAVKKSRWLPIVKSQMRATPDNHISSSAKRNCGTVKRTYEDTAATETLSQLKRLCLTLATHFILLGMTWQYFISCNFNCFKSKKGTKSCDGVNSINVTMLSAQTP